MKDIYFEPNYGKLYEALENGRAEVFEFEHEYGKIIHQFIKRTIPIENSPTEYVDLVTPYGYGGPVIMEGEPGKEEELTEAFHRAFADYCKENNVVSEFVRFHPIAGNAEDFKNIYDVNYIRNTVGTNLKAYDDPFQEEFSKSCRKNVRKALKKGVLYRVTERPSDISRFKEIYYSTMDRNNASDYYYFDDTYFDNCVKYFQENLLTVEAIYNDETIAMGLYFIYDKTIHIHLSGTLTEYLHLSPAYVLRYAVTEWGKENGYELIHHGGGRSNDPEDSLYKFKKQFGKNTDFRFSVGKRIWNPGIYSKLLEDNRMDADTDFFPAYRQGLRLQFKEG